MRSMTGQYDVAQICLNGHVINDSTKAYPQHNQDHCDQCGEKTIAACPNCNSPIRGHYYSVGLIIPSQLSAPAFCYQCGSQFPWTERKVQAAIEMFVEDGAFSATEKETLKQSVQEIVSDSPRTQVGAVRVKKALAKIGIGTASAVKDVLVDIVSEAAKKIIWPN